MLLRAAPPLILAVLLASCARSQPPTLTPMVSAVALTGGPAKSMVYLARTSNGIIAIDLGWWGGADAVLHQLRALNATPADVTAVFLTHSHRDHIGAWRLVRGSTFHLAEKEVPRLFGDTAHGGVIPRAAEAISSSDFPRDGDIRVLPFSKDTAFVFDRDTVHAFLVPGHTAGSAAYLFRGVLLVGDAVGFTHWFGFTPARHGYSDDTRQAAASLTALLARLPPGAVRQVCTAHAHCREYSRFLADIQR